jgi:hypothetical protein
MTSQLTPERTTSLPARTDEAGERSTSLAPKTDETRKRSTSVPAKTAEARELPIFLQPWFLMALLSMVAIVAVVVFG